MSTFTISSHDHTSHINTYNNYIHRHLLKGPHNYSSCQGVCLCFLRITEPSVPLSLAGAPWRSSPSADVWTHISSSAHSDLVHIVNNQHKKIYAENLDLNQVENIWTWERDRLKFRDFAIAMYFRWKKAWSLSTGFVQGASGKESFGAIKGRRHSYFFSRV